MNVVRHEYLVVDKIVEDDLLQKKATDFSSAVMGVYPTRAEARKVHSELGGALEGFGIVQITTVVIEKRIR